VIAEGQNLQKDLKKPVSASATQRPPGKNRRKT
jgi:hypothetical protein